MKSLPLPMLLVAFCVACGGAESGVDPLPPGAPIDSGVPSTDSDAGATAGPTESSGPSGADAGVTVDAGVEVKDTDAGVVVSPPPEVVHLDVPYVTQKPALPRGCEVTSLSMLLAHAGVKVDKMLLAEQVEKVPYLSNGLNGNPYDGFVGDMYDFAKPGYGVYHGPIKRLAARYLPNRIVDLSSSVTFDELLANHLAQGRPVWVITNATWDRLPTSSFTTWKTSSGDVKITWHEHSVVLTGYDATSIYVNDPLDPARGKDKKLDLAKFRAAWEQMGRQAITYLP